MLAKKTFNDPRIRWSTAVPYGKSTAVPSNEGTGKGTKKIPRCFSTRYCPPLSLQHKTNRNTKIFLPVDESPN